MDAAKLTRTTLTTSRLLDFLSVKELTAQIGHEVRYWLLVLLKELVDNALDACEEAGVPPRITISVDDGVTVADNGPGIPAEVVERILDFASRTSSREPYVAPDRGKQGNALKTVLAMPFVLDGQQGRVEITSQGIRHEIVIRVDQIRQQPVIEHQKHVDGEIEGTTVKVFWPKNSPSSQTADEDQFLQNADDEFENGDDGENSPSSILSAKSRFLQIADDYTFLNPHLSIAVDWFGERLVDVQATTPNWPKWNPSAPTCAHWYESDHLARLLAGYVAHDADTGRERTVREFVSEFAGLTGTAKQKAVLEATGLARAKLTEMVAGDALDMTRVQALLTAMKSHSKPVKPSKLGVIGKAHLAEKLSAIGCQMESFEYRKIECELDGVPRLAEVAFAWLPGLSERRFVTGVNWSVGLINPFRELSSYGDSLDSILGDQRCGREEPVVLVLHLADPRAQFTDRGKSAVVVPDSPWC